MLHVKCMDITDKSMTEGEDEWKDKCRNHVQAQKPYIYFVPLLTFSFKKGKNMQ